MSVHLDNPPGNHGQGLKAKSYKKLRLSASTVVVLRTKRKKISVLRWELLVVEVKIYLHGDQVVDILAINIPISDWHLASPPRFNEDFREHGTADYSVIHRELKKISVLLPKSCDWIRRTQPGIPIEESRNPNTCALAVVELARQELAPCHSLLHGYRQ
ncbi:hypothetical protein ACJJTC_017083 [Scirpophaga incertulas]